MNEAANVLWHSIQPMLRDFAARIADSDATVSYSVDSFSNEAFLIRAFASLRKKAADDEIAVTVDAAFEDGKIALSADACMDNGEVLAEGPEATMSSSAILSSSEMPLAEWLERFEGFLNSIEAAIKERVAILS